MGWGRSIEVADYRFYSRPRFLYIKVGPIYLEGREIMRVGRGGGTLSIWRPLFRYGALTAVGRRRICPLSLEEGRPWLG